MKTKTIRLTVAIFSTCFFMAVMFYKPVQIGMNVAVQNKQLIRVPVRIEKTSEVISEIKNGQTEEHLQQEEYIDSYLNLDNADNGNITAPVIDYQKVYAKMLYPASMKRKNTEAFFQVRIFVNRNGNLSVSVPDNIERAFADSVTKAFKNITVQPALLDGKPIDVTFTIPIQFVLN